MSAELDSLAGAIAADGFAFQRRTEMRRTLDGSLSDWASFSASWDDLGLDTYMADGGRYRKRRHAAFGAWRNGPASLLPSGGVD